MRFLNNQLIRRNAQEWLKDNYPAWSALSEENKKIVLEKMIASQKEGLEDIDGVFSKAEEFLNNWKILLAGLVLGIFGGLLSNIVHDYLSSYKYYPLSAFFISGVGIFLLSLWTNSKVKKIINSHPITKAALEETERK
jgi:hypothetical protein